MCFYDQTVFGCGDWRWGPMRRQCQREYRQGETCGSRLVNVTNYTDDKCTVCQSLEKKHRRLAKTKSDYERWRQDPQRQASAAKAAEEYQQIKVEISKLDADRVSRYTNIGSNRRPIAQS